MKIVHEFHGKQPQATCGAHPYHGTTEKPPEWCGMRVECLVVDSTQPEFDENGKEVKPFWSGDCLYIEGDSKSVRMALQDVIDQIDSLEELYKAEFEKEKVKYRECPNCHRWAHPKYDYHGDGKGNECRFPQ